MKEFFLPVLVATVLLVALGAYGYQYLLPRSEQYIENQLHGMRINKTGIDITVANTKEKREHGLSGLSSLPPKAGLLMIFDKADYHGIWMKDMNFAIDVIWIDDSLRVVDISEVLRPDTFPAIFEPQKPARMALEVNAQFAATYNIKIGDIVEINEQYLPADLKK